MKTVKLFVLCFLCFGVFAYFNQEFKTSRTSLTHTDFLGFLLLWGTSCTLGIKDFLSIYIFHFNFIWDMKVPGEKANILHLLYLEIAVAFTS